ncbi:MAG: glycine--tRNA ligase subunit beta [Candidatus Desantisbacteria bacterium]
MPDLLLEIGTEEIPAGYIQPGLDQMMGSVKALLLEERIEFEKIQTYGTPRRLVVFVIGVAVSQEDADIEVIGPIKSVAFDSCGIPTRAAEGFAKSQGVGVENFKIKSMPKGEYICITKHIKGKAAIEILQENLPKLITGISFPKSMRWGNKEIRFARPIRWMLALLDDEVVSFELDGISSDRITQGHRFLAPSPITISHSSDYLPAMEKAFVIVDIDSRRKMIVSGIQEIMTKLNVPYYEPDKNLLDEVACLVEYPVVLVGSFEEKYLALPQAVVITSMCEHQRYFPVMDGNALLPYFLVVANTAKSPDIVREGNERVLRARLSDAAFFWDSDRKVSLDERVEQQKKVVWQEKVGTLYEKTQRIVEIAEWINSGWLNLDIERVQRAAWLCKADLLTEMVGEFPTLQGIMGYHYALAAGEPEDIAIAIKEHYLPKSFDDNIPESPMGAIVSIADKIDSIVACFNVGLIPTGSEDPYALRRQAQGIINIILKQNLPINLLLLAEEACNCCHAQQEIALEAMKFLKQRLEYAIINMGFAADTVAAILEVDSSSPSDALLRVTALEEIRKMPDIEPLSISFKRVMNILKKEQWEGVEAVIESLLTEESERNLYQSIQGIKKTVEVLVEKADYLGALSLLATLRQPIDQFFDTVMVMVEDTELRENRLALLKNIAGLFLKVADISLLRNNNEQQGNIGK